MECIPVIAKLNF